MRNTEEKISAREAARRRQPLGGADTQALEGALTLTERERDKALTALKTAERERDEYRDAIVLVLENRDTDGDYAPLDAVEILRERYRYPWPQRSE